MWEGSAFEWLASRLAKAPDAIALRSLDRRSCSYRQLAARVQRTVGVLRASGLGRNDRIAVVLPGGPEMATACLSISAGATCVPLNPDYARAELEYFLTHLEIRALVHSPAFPTSAVEVARQLGLPIFDLTADPSPLPQDPLSRSQECGAFALSPEAPHGKAQDDLATAGDGFALDDDVAFVLHTSGSTARPKVVPLSHRQLRLSAANVARSLSLEATDCCLNMLPLFHVGALVDLLLAPLSVGGEVIVSDRLSSDAFFEALDRFEPTWYQGVPTMLRDVTDRARAAGRPPEANRLRFIRSVSAALPLALLEEIETTFDTPVIEIYGMTETAGLITSNPLPPGRRKPGSVGIPAGPEIQVIDEAGNPVRPGKSGEVLVRGENVFLGYEAGYEAPPEAPPRARDDRDSPDRSGDFIGRWLRTGDEGRVDDEGYLFLTGRIKEIINRGGEKISPREIDEIAAQHPAILEAAAFALPHETLGEEVGLAVVCRPAAELDDASLIGFLRERLAYYKVPRSIVRMDALPKGGSGKLQRHRLGTELALQDDREDRPPYAAPETDRARRLAALWEAALGVRKIGLDDDFFDLGGDSLKAAGFIAELQESHAHPIEAAALFDGPTLREFDAYLALTECDSDDSTTDSELGLPPGIRGEIYEPLAPYLAAWRGTRRDARSLLVGRNTLGTRPPLFWGVQGFKEFEALASRLDPDQPIYGFRSLYKVVDKDDSTNQELADYYVSEIREIHPQGPILIGGFCEAAKIAFKIARTLGSTSRPDAPHVALLALQEQFVPEPYAGRVAFFFCAPGNHSPYQYYQRPERGWSKFYTGETALYESKDSHDDYYGERGIDAFVSQLEDAIDSALSGTPTTSLHLESGLQRLPENAYRARITFEAPRFMTPGEKVRLPVVFENRSETAWLPTRESGIILANRWLNPRGKHKIWTDGRADLDRVVAPGDEIRLDIGVEAPPRSRGWRRCTLELDLVDEGVSWFSDKGSIPARQRIRLSNRAPLFNRILSRLTLKKTEEEK